MSDINMENDHLNSDNTIIERSLKKKQQLLAIHGIGMVVLSFWEYYLSFLMSLNDLKYWFSVVFLSYD